MIAKVPHFSTAQAGSFKPVRKHPLMLLNQALMKPSLAQSHACSHHQLPNSHLNSCPGRATFLSQGVLSQSFNNGRGELSCTRRWKPSSDEFGSESGVPTPLAAPRHLLWPEQIHGAAASSQDVIHVLQAPAAMEGGALPCSIPAQALSHCCIFCDSDPGTK